MKRIPDFTYLFFSMLFATEYCLVIASVSSLLMLKLTCLFFTGVHTSMAANYFGSSTGFTEAL